MTSLEPFVLKIKPAMDAFLHRPTKQSLSNLENELAQFNWVQMNIFNVQILVPLVLKLDELINDNQDLRTGCLQCIKLVTSKVYLKELTALRTMLIIALKQIRECDKACTRENLSEEIKLAVVQCISECLRRSTSDVLEQFYTNENAMILGQILLTLVEFIENEKYKKLVIASLECLMIAFYVHDDADQMDVVLRNQVADTLFIFLPKVITILHKTALGDDKQGESIKINSIKALGRILCVIYEETTDDVAHVKYDKNSFTQLLKQSLSMPSGEVENAEDDILALRINSRSHLEPRMKQMQDNGRSRAWMRATSKKLKIIFTQMTILRAHGSCKVRKEFAEMCCLLLGSCCHNLKENSVFMLENVMASSQDEDVHIRKLAAKCLEKLQSENTANELIFDENAEQLLTEHLAKLPRIIQRCEEAEQYAEFQFLKGFLKALQAQKLLILFSIPQNVEIFCMCLITALDLKVTQKLLVEEYSLREIQNLNADYKEVCVKFPWRQFKNLASSICMECLKDICFILGGSADLKQILMNYLQELLLQNNKAINEILLIMQWLTIANERSSDRMHEARHLMSELLDERHWNLALHADQTARLKVQKSTDWFIDRTPGLYESAVEIRTRDCDSDDESEDINENRVTMADAEFNVLHTCIVLEALGQCATYLGERFDGYIFQTLHRVLLKLAHSNTMIYQAAVFALVSVQKALRYQKITQLIEGQTDYITYHLNVLMKRAPESKSAMDILTVVLQFSSRDVTTHLEDIFQTIYEECCKTYQSPNIISYLKLFNAFLKHLSSWMLKCSHDLTEESQKANNRMDVDGITTDNHEIILTTWLDILRNPTMLEQDHEMNAEHGTTSANGMENISEINNVPENHDGNAAETKLPRHIEMIKAIIQQITKFLTSSNVNEQILALECLITGMPLLQLYENELLPLVHSVWHPLVEKFRQNNALVLNRCFSLLAVLAQYSKDFITKRSLDDVVPFLKSFLQKAAVHSAKETITAQTQEYKLQVKLIQELPVLIECMDLDGKHLNQVSEISSIYLSAEQPQQLQKLAVDYFIKLRHYNAPLLYAIVAKKQYLKLYENNVKIIVLEFGMQNK